MIKKIVKRTFNLFIGALLLFSTSAYCDVIPKDGQALNYVAVYFEEEFQKGAAQYELQLFRDSASVEAGAIEQSVRNKIPAFWLKLQWSHHYLWRIVSIQDDQQIIHQSAIHHFSIVSATNDAEFDDFKMDIIKNNTSLHSKGLLVLDCARGIYNYGGEAIWVLPHTPILLDKKAEVRDIRVTKDNTITFLTLNTGLEMDLDGNILWQLPSPFVFESDTISFHHDFKKTEKGNYIVLGNRMKYRKILGEYSKETIVSEFGVKEIEGQLYKKTELGLILEFNQKGELVWFWDADTYLTDEDLNTKKNPNGFPSLNSHMNAFSFNQDESKFYVGFRDLSRIIKIDKKSKKVEMQYGSGLETTYPKMANDLFHNQHDASITSHKSILVFNNGTMNEPSSVLELSEAAPGKPILWQFSLKYDSLSTGKSRKTGNVIELPNKNLLVCGGALNRNIEVSRDKKIVWDAFMIGKKTSDTIWQPVRQYRMNWVKELKRYYFLPELVNTVALKNDSLEITLFIHNTGNASDAFVFSALSGNRDLVVKKTTKDIAAGNKTQVKIRLKEEKDANSKIILRIKSVHSKNVKRVIIHTN